MEAEKLNATAISAGSLLNEGTLLEKNLSIYEVIREFYCALSNKCVQKDKLALLLSEEDFRQSDPQAQQAFIAEFCYNLQIQFKCFKPKMIRRADSAFKRCEKRHHIAQRNIYPPVNWPEIQAKHASLHNAIGRFVSFRFVDSRDPEQWKKYYSLFSAMTEVEADLIKSCWSEIEKHDKYRYDVLRYKFAFWSLLIAFIVFLLVNAPVAVKNVFQFFKFLHEYGDTNSPINCSSPIPGRSSSRHSRLH